eukprot:COSAG04_NODE_179_length_21356_cov_11.112998_15_plen_119_part_00
MTSCPTESPSLPVGAPSAPHPAALQQLTDACLPPGGGSGIGYVMAQQLGLHGAKLVLFGRRANFLEDACENLRAEGITCTFCAGDVRKPEDCAAAVATAVDSFGHLNVLINGAAGMCK